MYKRQVVSDLLTHCNYIFFLKKDLNNLFILTLGEDVNLINFPLHHLIFSQLNFINSINTYLVSVLIISFLLPLILYHVLKKHFENFDNDFEKVVIPTYPEIGNIISLLRHSGSQYAGLSGSGSTVFGVFDDEADAKSAESILAREHKTIIVDPV
mgnify:CR=1 FL=1